MLKCTIKLLMSLCKKQAGNLRVPSCTKRHSDKKNWLQCTDCLYNWQKHKD